MKYITVVSVAGIEVSIPESLKEQFLKTGYRLKKVTKGGKDGK